MPKDLYENPCKRFSLIKVQREKLEHFNLKVHPNFLGLFQCSKELFRCLSVPFDNNLSSTFDIWQDSQSSQNYLLYDFYHYLYLLNSSQQKIKCKIYALPSSTHDLRDLSIFSSYRLIEDMKRYQYNLDQMNPQRLNTLLNRSVSPTVILQLNRAKLSTSSYTMSLESLAELLGFTRHRFNYRIKLLKDLHSTELEALEQQSEIVKKLVQDRSYTLSAQDIWSIK